MKLFQHSSGMIIAFGFDMLSRKPDAHRVSWSDPQSKEWEMKADNMAGFQVCCWPVSPEFVHELGDGSVVAYSPGSCLVMRLMGAPYVWCFSWLTPDEKMRLAA